MGRLLRRELTKRGVDLRSAAGRSPLRPLDDGEGMMLGDLRDPPRQNAEDYAAEILQQQNPLDPVARQLQDGALVTLDYTARARRRQS